MKKSILFVIALFPLLASCNNNSRGFVNPFPEDRYNPIGFDFTNDERISRPLTTNEQSLVNKACEEKYDDLIREHSFERQFRDYTRAFAGEFKQGYSVPNIMQVENCTAFQQQKESTHKHRTVKNSTLNSTYDYSYGRNTSTITTHDWIYHANKDETTDNYSENDEGASVVHQRQSDDSSVAFGEVLKDETKPFTFGLEQSRFLIKTTECSTMPGADKNDDVILIKVVQSKYSDPDGGEEGIYELPDGRTYLAMQNSLTVSRLKLQPATGSQTTPWYLVTYARYYEETTITSDVIQPNVPISMLNNPIVIKYNEEIHNFYSQTSKYYDEPIDDIVIHEEEGAL